MKNSCCLELYKKWSDFTSNKSVENLLMSSKQFKDLSNKLFSLEYTKTHPALQTIHLNFS
jgi:hypothetical protein